MTTVSQYTKNAQRIRERDKRNRELIQLGREEALDDLTAVLAELYADYMTQYPAPEGWALLKAIAKRMRVTDFKERVTTELQARKDGKR